MNLESQKSKKPAVVEVNDDFDFDFKPITSGLGFNTTHKPQEIKPVYIERQNIQVAKPITTTPAPRKENKVYQDDLSIFYGNNTSVAQAPAATPAEEPAYEKIARLATKPERIFAYILDLGLVLSCLGIVMTVMAANVNRDLMQVWSQYPNEITPLVVTLFCGFYLIYFSIFEKTSSSTLGKNLMKIHVVNQDNKQQSFSTLLLRSVVSLLNFVSLGLFSYFDLQNKISHSKVIKVD